MPDLVLLTGPTRGLGLALYRQLEARSQRTLVIGRNLDRLPNAGSNVVDRLECDLAEIARPENALLLATRLTTLLRAHTFRSLTFISNAGTVEPIGLVGDVPLDRAGAAMAVNVVAPMIIARACCAVCRERDGRLTVLNVSSGAAIRPIPGWALYCSGKAAARMFFDVMAGEGAAEVRHIDPGVIDTDMQARIRAAETDSFPWVERFRAMAKEERLQSPDSVAARILDQLVG